MKVKDKVIVVTGGGGGIGQQLVLGLLKQGAAVAAVDLSPEGLAETRGLAGSLAQRLSLHEVDITDRAAVVALAGDVVNRHGCVDGIINNAGIIHRFAPFNDLDYASIERVINVNLYGSIHIIKSFLPLLLERPVAHIANVSSMGGVVSIPDQTLYCASKAALTKITEGLYSELQDTHIGVTAVFPGAVSTRITQHSGVQNDKLEDSSLRDRITSPESAAKAIIRGIETNRFRVFIGMDARILTFFYRVNARLATLFVARVMKAALPD